MAATRILELATGAIGDVAGRAGRFTRYAADLAFSLPNKVGGGTPKADMDDVTLARKVESIVFRPAGAPRGSVDVNVVEGIVYLRGEVKTPQRINALEKEVRAIPEVRGVENLLHLPNTPAPTRADAPRKQQKARRTAPRSANPRAGTGRSQRVSTERTTAPAEPSPSERAVAGEGRGPAPLGSDDTTAS